MARRGQGEGLIRQRKDGLWEARISVGYVNGKRRRKSYYGKTKTEVRERMQAALRDLSTGLPLPDERVTLGHFIEKWLDGLDDRVRPATAYRYRNLMRRHVLPDLGHVKLRAITAAEIQSLFGRLTSEKGLSPRTVLQVRAVLRSALNRAVRWDMLARNVVALTDPPKAPDWHVPPMSPELARAILDAVGNTWMEPVVTVALYTGLRQGELLGLTWEHVEFDAQVVRVERALQWDAASRSWRLVELKTRRSRRLVPLLPTAALALRRWRTNQIEARLAAGEAWCEKVPGLVFTTRLGAPMHGSTVTHTFQKLIDSAGLPRRRFHDLRHGFATLLLASKSDLKIVSETLGHSTITLTADTYARVLPALQREAAGRLEALLLPPDEPDRRKSGGGTAGGNAL